ncbi:MAG: STAS domain-containing protein [Actinobacteria bacterium]|nr:MAG: STAS domain-containing protein [Actinomycetota bacterium]
MEDVSIRLPAASPATYLRYLEWWRDLARFLERDAGLKERSRAMGGPVDALAVQVLGPTHASEIDTQARGALNRGDAEVAPVITGRPVLWRIALTYADRRMAWLRDLARERTDVPPIESDVDALRASIHQAVRAALDALPVILDIQPLDRPGTFRLAGELDLSNAEELYELLASELKSGYRLFLDLSGVSFMDSNGIRVLIRLARAAQQMDLSPVVLTSASAAVHRVLDIALPSGMPGLEVRPEG